MNFLVGDKVTCNGNPEGRVIAVRQYGETTMYEVRLWDGFRLVGDVCVGAESLKINEAA